MNRELLDKAKTVLQGAVRRGAQGARVGLSRSRESSVEWRDGKLERLKHATSMGLALDLFVDNRYSSNGTSDLRPEALEKFLDDTVAATRLLAQDEHRKLPDPARYTGMFTGDLGLRDAAGLAAIQPEDRRRLAEKLETAVRASEPSAPIISTTCTWEDDETESVLVTSNGMEGGQESGVFAAVAQVSVRDTGDRKPVAWDYAVCRRRTDLPKLEDIASRAVTRAVARIGARAEPSGLYPCVIENRTADWLINWLLAPLSGSAIQQQRSFFADKIGQPFLAERLTLIDDPLLVGGLGSRTFDAEGMSCVRLPLFEKGVLRNFYLDTYYASKLGLRPTTGGTTNVILEPGAKDLDGLLAAMDKGLLITGFSGGNSNPATGDFSVGIKGLWIEAGKPVRPVAEMNLAGNHLSFWKQVAEVGVDANPYSAVRTPSLRFEPVQFSGS